MKAPMTAVRAALLAFAPLLAMSTVQAATNPSVLVQVTQLQQGSLPRTVTGYGTVQPAPSASTLMMAPEASLVSEVLVRQGQKVAQGAALLKLDPSPASAAAYTQARTGLQVATDLVQRTRKMVKQRLATAQQLASAEKAERDARATLNQLKAQGASGTQTLRAPHDAIVTSVSASQGALVANGARLLALARPSQLELRVGVIPSQAQDIHAGDPVQITPLGDQQQYQGQVASRGAAIDPATGLVPIDVTLPPGTWFPGAMAEASISSSQAHGYRVPHKAILVDNKGAPYVVQIVNQSAQQVPVKILASNGKQDVIVGKLDASAPLVLSGNYQLQNGMQVRYDKGNAGASR